MQRDDRPVVTYDTGRRYLGAAQIPFGNQFTYTNYRGEARDRGVGDSEIFPCNPMDEIIDKSGLEQWTEEYIGEYDHWSSFQGQQHYLKEIYLRSCMLHLGDDLLKEATPEVVALSGASEEEVNQVFIIRGLGGEICRFRRPGRSLTVKGRRPHS